MQAKQAVLATGWVGDTSAAHAASAVCSGLVSSVLSTPADVIKTRLMNQDPARPLYRGTWDCARQTVRAEGLPALYKGCGVLEPMPHKRVLHLQLHLHYMSHIYKGGGQNLSLSLSISFSLYHSLCVCVCAPVRVRARASASASAPASACACACVHARLFHPVTFFPVTYLIRSFT